MKEIGMIGIGKMGHNLALKLLDEAVKVSAYDPYASDEIKRTTPLSWHATLEAFVMSLKQPRVIWLMIPAGDSVTDLLAQLSRLLDLGDIIIDGGNSRYTDTMQRAKQLVSAGIHLIDCGTSGGTSGAREGAALMVGGAAEAVAQCAWVFELLATEHGYAHLGPSGSGHFIKMVHNGIEYGMMQAIGEGFELLDASPFDIDYEAVAKVWSHGSIIEGLLMRTVADALAKDPHLETLEGRVDDSGEGRWTVETAVQLSVAAPVITQALYSRFKSKDNQHFSEKLIAAMRNEFGGHKVYKK